MQTVNIWIELGTRKFHAYLFTCILSGKIISQEVSLKKRTGKQNLPVH